MLKKISYSIGALALAAFLAGCQSTSTSGMGYEDDANASNNNNNSAFVDDGNVNVVYFGFDSSDIRQDQSSKIEAQAKAIKGKSNASVTVEGHTDEIGTVDYNIALGERRASIVKDALVEQGVEEEKINTVTYGKSRLADDSGNSSARAKNRRAVTVIE